MRLIKLIPWLIPRNWIVYIYVWRRGDYSELSTDDNDVPLRQPRIRHEQTLEAEILPNDTLASISLRFNCSVQDIRRLNKIDKDNEIFAFKVLKVPLTAQNILLDTLPKVHRSGQNSPSNKEKVATSTDAIPNQAKLEEKLLVASVSNAVIAKSEDAADSASTSTIHADVQDPLLDRAQFRGYPRTFGAPKNDFISLTDGDCELNWIVLLLVILAICVIVPLIYVYVAYEHPEEFTHSRYDDDTKRAQHYVPHNSSNHT